MSVDVVDPYADSGEVKKEYGFELSENIRNDYNAVVVAVAHREFLDLEERDFMAMLNCQSVLVDIKGLYRGKIKELNYWSL